MTDESMDRLVRRADPYDSEISHDLRGADHALMEEIMNATPDTKDDLKQRRAWRRPLAGLLVAASVLAVAISLPALAGDPEPGPRGKGAAVQTPGGSDQIVYAAAAVEVAKNNPRLLIDEPGWKATTVYGFAKDSGTIAFRKGDREIEMNWYPADSYQSYFDDRTEVGKRESITVDGQAGSRVSYSDTDIAAMLEPEGPTFVEIRTVSGFTSTADVLKLFDEIKHVSVAEWLAVLPPEIVIPGKAAEVADEILADVPVPPGFDKAGLAKLGVNSRYHFGAEIMDGVVCGWLNEWERADKAGNVAAEQEAVDALKGARGWSILDEMQKTGEYSPGVWDLADRVKVGDDPRKYLENFGSCHPDR